MILCDHWVGLIMWTLFVIPRSVRERERECVCVRERERERQREKDRERLMLCYIKGELDNNHHSR